MEPYHLMSIHRLKCIGVAAALCLALAGCSVPHVMGLGSYYQVSDPVSGKVYFTQQIEREPRHFRRKRIVERFAGGILPRRQRNRGQAAQRRVARIEHGAIELRDPFGNALRISQPKEGPIEIPDPAEFAAENT